MPNRYLEWAEPTPKGDSPHSEAGRVPPAWAKPMVCHIVGGKDGERKTVQTIPPRKNKRQKTREEQQFKDRRKFVLEQTCVFKK